MDKNNKLFKAALAETYKYASLLNIKEHAKMSYNDIARAIRESSQFRGIRSVEVQQLAESVTKHLKESVMAEIDLDIEESFADGMSANEVATRIASIYNIKLSDAEHLVTQWQHANSDQVNEAASALQQWKTKVKAKHPDATFKAVKKTDRYSDNRVEAYAGDNMVGYYDKKTGRSNVLESFSGAIAEVGYADALGQLNADPAEIVNSATVDGTIGQRDVLKYEQGNTCLYFFETNGDIVALVLLDGDSLRAIQNTSGEKGLVFGLLNYVVNMKNTPVYIRSDEPLTAEGFKWVAKLIQNRAGLRVRDQHGNDVDVATLKAEWQKSKSTGGEESGPTELVISEASASWKKKITENEQRLMPFSYFQVNENFSGAIAEESNIKPGDRIRTIKMGQTPGVVEKVENGWVIFRHESGKLYRAPLSNVRLDESLSGRSSFDREHQRFKHDELSQELKHEDEWYHRAQAQQTGKWYIRVDGRVWRKDGQPVEFKGRNHANAVAIKIQAKTPGRIVTITTEPRDTPKHKLFKEAEMAPSEKKKRERIVKGMKKNKTDFKNRYGKRGDEVMYATATKMATEDADGQADMVINKLAYSRVHPNNISRFKREARDYLANNKSSPASTLMAGLQALAHFFARRSVSEGVSFSKAITEGYQDELAAAREILRAANREYSRTNDRSVLDRAHREYARIYDKIVQKYPEDHSEQAARNQVWGPAGTNESADSVVDSPEYNRLIDRVPHRVKQQRGIDAVAQAVEAAVRRKGAAAQVSDVMAQLADRDEAEDWHDEQRNRSMYKSMGWL